jgi:hypothetical protein
MANTVVSYPIPPFQNVPIHAEFYLPSRFVISAVLRGKTTLVTTTINHNYVTGQLVRFIIPPSFGIRQLNEQSGYIIPWPNSYQPTMNLTPTNGTPLYTTNLLTTILISFPNAVIVPNTVLIYIDFGAGDQTLIKDDGNGGLRNFGGTYTVTAGAINYTTGSISLIFAITTIPPNNTPVNVSFNYNTGILPNQVLVNINSNGYDPYTSSSATTVAQILAIGNINPGAINTNNLSTSTFIPGSFIDISPL